MSDTELSSTSESEIGLEVVEPGRRRRRWSAEEKARIVGEALSGEESVSAVARRHGVTAQQLYGWRRRGGTERTGSEELGFATVLVARSATCLGEAEAASLRRRQVEIELCGMTIRVSPGSDEATLRAVLQAAKAVS